MLGYEEKVERIELIDAVCDAGRLARGLDQLLESLAHADPQPASSRAFPPRTSAEERRASTAASGFLRICPPVLEAAEPGQKDGGGCQGEHEASERSREERARRACGVDEGLHPERP